MTNPNRYRPRMETRCPLVPTTVDIKGTPVPLTLTDWEQDQVQRWWRNALSALGDLQAGLTTEADKLHNMGRHHVPDNVVHYDHRVTGGGLAHDAMQAEAAMAQLARVIDGAVHRTAEAVHKLAERREYEVVDDNGHRWAGPFGSMEAAGLAMRLLRHEDANAPASLTAQEVF